MIYLDTSVALAHLLGETRRPPDALWGKPLLSSRLLEYELLVRINARGLARSHTEPAYEVVGRCALLELSPPVLARALQPFPIELRTLHALHLASLMFLRDQGTSVSLATYDERMSRAARALQVPLADC